MLSMAGGGKGVGGRRGCSEVAHTRRSRSLTHSSAVTHPSSPSLTLPHTLLYFSPTSIAHHHYHDHAPSRLPHFASNLPPRYLKAGNPPNPARPLVQLTKSIIPPYLLLADIFYTWMAQSPIRTLTSKERYGRIFKTSPYRTYPRQQRSSSGSHQSNWVTESCVASRRWRGRRRRNCQIRISISKRQAGRQLT